VSSSSMLILSRIDAEHDGRHYQSTSPESPPILGT
jgi:hypothetical protein